MPVLFQTVQRNPPAADAEDFSKTAATGGGHVVYSYVGGNVKTHPREAVKS